MSSWRRHKSAHHFRWLCNRVGTLRCMIHVALRVRRRGIRLHWLLSLDHRLRFLLRDGRYHRKRRFHSRNQIRKRYVLRDFDLGSRKPDNLLHRFRFRRRRDHRLFRQLHASRTGKFAGFFQRLYFGRFFSKIVNENPVRLRLDQLVHNRPFRPLPSREGQQQASDDYAVDSHRENQGSRTDRISAGFVNGGPSLRAFQRDPDPNEHKADNQASAGRVSTGARLRFTSKDNRARHQLLSIDLDGVGSPHPV
jgi:hypothetical protein